MHIKEMFKASDKRINISVLVLVIFGSLMIASAEMGVSAGNTAYLTGVVVRQIIYVIAAVIVYFVLMFLNVYKFRMGLYYLAYLIILGALLACRLFGQINGAYAWIQIGGGATIQPSEFAKVFMIGLAAKMLSVDRHEKNIDKLKHYVFLGALYFVIILIYQHDLGSAIVLFLICYCMILIPSFKEYAKYQRYMILGIFLAIGGALLLLSDPVTEILKAHSDNYMVGRFLAAADPFLYQYDNGYHIIMSLVSFANGGIFGLGYGNSIHKYMNFPNPSNDFILPVIVEELGIIGFGIFIIFYGLMLYPLISYSLKTQMLSSKIIFLGVFIYFIAHLILNIGGVSGLIPLTGVPILMISSGGSSLMACLGALGLAQNHIIRNREALNENNSGKI